MSRVRSLVLLVASTLAAVAAYDWAFGGLRIRYRLTDHRRRDRREQLAANPPHSGDIVLLGDSLTARGDWTALLPRDRVRNFGIDWDHCEQVLDRLAPITAAHPEVISLLIGTNDTGAGTSVADVVKGIVAVIDRIRSETPDTLLIVHTLPPRNDRWRQTIPQVNEQIRRVASARDLPVVDLHALLADDQLGLDAELASDKVHLSEVAYRRWAAELLRELPPTR